MSSTATKWYRKKWLRNALRWGIAVFGCWYVLSNMSWYDRVLVPDTDGWPVALRLAEPATESSSEFKVIDRNGAQQTFTRQQVFTRAEFARVQLTSDETHAYYDVIARRADPSNLLLVATPRNLWQRYWNQHSSALKLVHASNVTGRRLDATPYPVIDQGIGPMLRRANPKLLFASLAVFLPIFFIVAYRWDLLLGALEIRMRYWQAFVLTMIGAFYNTFLLGSTGGDVLKAYYASKFTSHRTRAVLSVIIDRVIGLLALVLLGGVAATSGMFVLPAGDSARHRCEQVAIASLLIFVGTAVCLLIFYVPRLRRVSGLQWLISRLPRQKQVHSAVETMELLRHRPLLAVGSILMTLPVHGTVVLSASLACMALGLELPFSYYWVVVPVVVLSGAIPISPQGAGVMEAVAFVLIRGQGLTISHAVVLTMSIRLVQILWNLTGGLFVLKGGYHAPTEKEKLAMESDLPDGKTPAPIETGFTAEAQRTQR